MRQKAERPLLHGIALTVRADATNEENLQRIQNLIT
jgi:hypothetical protein